MSAKKTTMTKTERRAVVAISSIIGLRMVGLFMVLPLFTLYATHLKGATPALVGIAIGIYGLSQALFQIPFGSLSDHFGRKPIIVMGLVIFALGSFIAAYTQTIHWMIIGRGLQGVGAVGSTLLAMMADLTREECRTKSMAIAGMTIGLSFSIAMLLGPFLSQWLLVNQLFYIATFFGLTGILLLYMVPTPSVVPTPKNGDPEIKSLSELFMMPELAKLNMGIFILHAIFTASFVVIPISLQRYLGFAANHQWQLYVPILTVAFAISLFFIGLAERRKQIRPYFLGGIVTLALAEIFLWLTPHYTSFATIGLCLFFAGFSLLEAFLPSLISRTAPAARKGSAMGIYSCSQFLGIFMGGFFGGWLFGQFGFSGPYLFSLCLAFFWFIFAYRMQTPQPLTPHLNETIQHPDFIQLKEQLQSK